MGVAIASLTLLLGACSQNSDVGPESEPQSDTTASNHFETDPTGDSIFTDDAGNEIAVGENLTLPNNWPGLVPTPEGSLVAVSVIDEQTAVATWKIESDVFAVQEEYAQDLSSQGFEVSSDFGLSTDTIVVLIARGSGLDITISATTGEQVNDPGEITVVVNPSV